MFKNKWNKKKPTDPSSDKNIDFIFIDSNFEDSLLEVKRGSDVIPEWYKKISATALLHKNDKKEDLTIKRCIPVLDAFTSGYYLVTTRDINFKYDKEKNESSFSGNQINKSHITMHPFVQIENIDLSPEFIKYAFKWGSSYLIKTPKGYSCLFTHPLNATGLPFYTLAGVVETDTYFQPVLFPFLMKNNFEGIIPKGTPVVQVIPFKRNNWKYNIINNVSKKFKHQKEIISKQYESERYDKNGNVTGGMYKKDYRKKKRYL